VGRVEGVRGAVDVQVEMQHTSRAVGVHRTGTFASAWGVLQYKISIVHWRGGTVAERIGGGGKQCLGGTSATVLSLTQTDAHRISVEK